MEALWSSRRTWAAYERETPHCRIGDPSSGPSPAELLKLEHLELLRETFTAQRGPGMDLQEFQKVLRSTAGPEVDVSWVERFFSEVDLDGCGRVSWQQLCSYLHLEFAERERASVPRPALLDAQPLIRHCPHNMREPMVRVVAITHHAPLRYLSVGKGGQLTVWGSGLQIQRTLKLAGDPTEEVAHTRRFRGWTTDAVFMEDARRVAVATDRRDVHFINVSRANVHQDIHLYGFRSVPTSLCYHQDAKSPGGASLLLLGDDKGGVHMLNFLTPSGNLFQRRSSDGDIHRVYFSDLAKHDHLVSYRHVPAVHQGPISRVMFDAGADVVMTSSEGDDDSLICANASLRQEPFVWRVKQGVKCFDFDSSLLLLVSGGCDRIVRLWSRFVSSRPVAELVGHRTTVLDVAFYRPLGQVLSYSRDADLRLWDITSHQCLRTISLQFPCLQPGRLAEHGNFPFLLLTPPLPAEAEPHLLVGCKDYLARLGLAPPTREGGAAAGPGGPVTCALYSAPLRQVVTGHADSSLRMWDVDTGRRRMEIRHAHGDEAVTCAALDSSHKRVVTGAQNGTIKVWNALNGLNLHKLEPVGGYKVTGVTCLHGNKLLAVGLSRQIAQYDIAAAEDLCVRADMSWKSSGVHRAAILAACHCSALGVVATASEDGEVVLWRLDTQGPTGRLRRHTQDGVAPPVDGLLFLQRRAEDRRTRTKGVLVSSQAGWLCFWGVGGHTRPHAEFYAPGRPGERVLGLGADPDQNHILVTGDTSGLLQMWDVAQYGLDPPHLAAPPLLRSWTAHQGEPLCVDVLTSGDAIFVLAVSADGRAGLWTRDGDHVGTFGQEAAWSLRREAVRRTAGDEDEDEDGAGKDEDGRVKGHPADL